MDGRPCWSSATIAPSITVSSGGVARAVTTAGYRALKFLLFRDRRRRVPWRLKAMAR